MVHGINLKQLLHFLRDELVTLLRSPKITGQSLGNPDSQQETFKDINATNIQTTEPSEPKNCHLLDLVRCLRFQMQLLLKSLFQLLIQLWTFRVSWRCWHGVTRTILLKSASSAVSSAPAGSLGTSVDVAAGKCPAKSSGHEVKSAARWTHSSLAQSSQRTLEPIQAWHDTATLEDQAYAMNGSDRCMVVRHSNEGALTCPSQLLALVSSPQSANSERLHAG